MNTFFCSDYTREVGEDLIGSATNYETYILVECPPPWTTDAFNSRWVPKNLHLLAEEINKAKLPIRFLVIANDVSHKADQTTLLIYQKKQGFSNGYQKYEFHLPNIEQVAGVVKKWLHNKTADYPVYTDPTRDILVCTHGSHDKCCARYGNPFYFHATATIANLNLDNVRLWKSSHFGGHRFAPTAIDLPEARYYGVLDQDSFMSILTRTGDIKCLAKVYRGWGILPSPLQVLERELILHHGWDWFNYKVVGRILEQSLDNNTFLTELNYESEEGSIYTYQATIVKDNAKSLQLKSACNSTQHSMLVKYAVANLCLTSTKMVSLSK
ncbi:sucrase ferredoxin [Nostoc sp. FACHB-152]|uniref:sucrase ferredoxin n=1 Tax=unclassified Nostoc TaxID=2593658 RepID=UPI00168684C5|nr:MULTISPECIES: sucrase ferredoxin [unclassified Nostoc]MBD2446698.1 sucrase ferredoxin [Nostoc sp. FACHB-152]MBD2466546.1 sucrase ferredoxin [Nostoc sp. FACHB-145]